MSDNDRIGYSSGLGWAVQYVFYGSGDHARPKSLEIAQIYGLKRAFVEERGHLRFATWSQSSAPDFLGHLAQLIWFLSLLCAWVFRASLAVLAIPHLALV